MIILNGGERLIVVFVPELALRSPSLPGIDSSAKRDFVLVLRHTYLGIKFEFGGRTCDVPLVMSKRKRYMH